MPRSVALRPDYREINQSIDQGGVPLRGTRSATHAAGWKHVHAEDSRGQPSICGLPAARRLASLFEAKGARLAGRCAPNWGHATTRWHAGHAPIITPESASKH